MQLNLTEAFLQKLECMRRLVFRCSQDPGSSSARTLREKLCHEAGVAETTLQQAQSWKAARLIAKGVSVCMNTRRTIITMFSLTANIRGKMCAAIHGQQT
eukprot:5376055-Amphidinium_carterae.2